MIEIILNGTKQTSSETNLSLFLSSRENQGANFAVALNEEFVPKCNYQKIELKSGDRIELVVPMQGG
ncbi:MAG: sulfur carrier protein ThiS [Kangiellaceae bacterium]|nr:sulfur carrier protein ThiS [Kangiellaceae bacterium]MCW9017207.1 sulfur carrier protein ThiS [Kangiellaceae bacterium]